ncbi:glucose-6-phosphate dehydrogenase [Marisediminicola senii]|uniref:glucose-6-phosphate dehydrogenase n=1 Tax=Marisediminicola senii TaxID=2711233 RepID=UPI0013EBCEE3|nr:glucose-6-phosphate dehydrogenase [Marisediminicola senii]
MTDSPRSLVILGAGGDLTSRLLLPGVGQFLASDRSVPVQLIGVGMDAMSDADWRARVTASFDKGKASGERIDALVASTVYLQADVTDADDLARIFAACTGVPAVYFALPPAVTQAACRALTADAIPDGTVFALEKPFGTDLESARQLNRELAELLPEDQLFRVDHFLGKSTVINMLGLRFANRIFDPTWTAEHIEGIEIVFDEPLGLEGRAGYYDTAGALVDMIQSHLLLVLALVTLEPPSSVESDDLRGAVNTVLAATRLDGDGPTAWSRRARYTGGTIDGRDFPSYVDEPGVVPSRNTETLAELSVAIDNARWAGVPIRLRSGKAVAGLRKEVIVTFKDVRHLPKGLEGTQVPNRLVISLSPDELSLDLNINGEGDPFTLDRVTLASSFAPGDFGPYGEVLAGILSGDPILSVRGDVVEECWRIVQPVLDAWRANEVPLEEYATGSTGPAGWPV